MTTIVTLAITLGCLFSWATGWQNVALCHNGATCNSSVSIRGHRCKYAIDGLNWYNKGWNANKQGVGIWIQVTFRKEYILTYGRVMQPFGRGEQNRKIKLSFSSGISVEEHLVQRTADRWTSYNGQHWDEFSLDHVRTRYVHIEVLEVYSSKNNGFIEVEFYTGINPCPLFYTSLGGRCYRYFYQPRVPWQQARKLCRHDNADLANIENAAEMSNVVQWLNKGLNLEERFWVLNSELEPSGETFSDLPPNEEASEVISNRTALYKPQVTPSNILWRSGGILGHVDSITPLSYICERESVYSTWRNVPSTSDTDSEETIPNPVAHTGILQKGDNTAVVGIVLFCAILILAQTLATIVGGYQAHQRLRMLEIAKTVHEANTYCNKL